MDNKNNIEQFDDLFKQAFEHATTNVPDVVWQGVSSATAGAGVASQASWFAKLFGLKGAAILGGVAAITGTAFWLANPTENQKEENPTENQITEVQSATEMEKIADIDDNLYEEQVNEVQSAENQVVQPGAGQDVVLVSGSDNEGGNGSMQIDGASEFVDNQGEEIQNPGSETLGPTSTIELPAAMFDVWQSRKNCCVNSAVEFKCINASNVSRLVWKLNGQIVAKDKRDLTLMFDRKGLYNVELEVTNKYTLERTSKMATVSVNGASADFDVDQMSDELHVSSKHPWASNQWYVNNVLVDGDRSTLVVGDQPGEVQITHVVTGVNGCNDTMRKTADILASCDIKIVGIPNVFTPYLTDGKNDEFDVELSEEADKFRMTIISPQTGEVVFETENPNEGWNGKQWNQGQLLPYGWYTYQIIYGCGNDTQQKRGKVLLAR